MQMTDSSSIRVQQPGKPIIAPPPQVGRPTYQPRQYPNPPSDQKAQAKCDGAPIFQSTKIRTLSLSFRPFRIEAQKAERIERHKHCGPRVSEDRRPQTCQPSDGCDKKHSF